MGAAVIGVGGAILGALVNQHGARDLAKHTLEGQRVLARDAARRDWRRQQIAPYIEAANQRMRIWVELHDVTATPDDRQRALALNQQLLDHDFSRMMATAVAVQDSAFSLAFNGFVKAEGLLKSSYTKDEVVDVVKRMIPALAELNKAAEHFLITTA